MLIHRKTNCDTSHESESCSVVSTLCTPWIIQSMRFSRPEYWSRQPFPSAGDVPNPEIEPRSPALQVDTLPTELSGKPNTSHTTEYYTILKMNGLKQHTTIQMNGRNTTSQMNPNQPSSPEPRRSPPPTGSCGQLLHVSSLNFH